jgi:hypothetical protein
MVLKVNLRTVRGFVRSICLPGWCALAVVRVLEELSEGGREREEQCRARAEKRSQAASSTEAAISGDKISGDKKAAKATAAREAREAKAKAREGAKEAKAAAKAASPKKAKKGSKEKVQLD